MNPLADLPQPSNQRALREIARDILGTELGGRLATSTQYQERFDVGAGTVQKALRALAASEALTLRTRGHQGTYVVRRDLGQLWHIAGFGPIRLLLTPPGADEHYGLAAGVQDAFRALGIPLVTGYLRGATQRAREVRDGDADLTVVSGGAAVNLRRPAGGKLTEVDLGPDTYYRPDSIVVVYRGGAGSHQKGSAKKARSRPLRVGIDRTSSDHDRLTRGEFSDDGSHSYVDCDFQQVPAEILRDRIDVGIWHTMDLLIPLDLAGLGTRPLRTDAAIATRTESSSAVLLADAGRAELSTVLGELDVATVRKTQDTVLSQGPDGDRLRHRRWAR